MKEVEKGPGLVASDDSFETSSLRVLKHLVVGTTYTVIATILLGIGTMSLSASAVYTRQLILVPGIVPFAGKGCARNRAAMKENATVGIDGSWHPPATGQHILSIGSRQSPDTWLTSRPSNEASIEGKGITGEAATGWKSKG
jgi:hypothetical protein